MGGLSSLKSAASTMAKKIDEFKEAISANATPMKDGYVWLDTPDLDQYN